MNLTLEVKVRLEHRDHAIDVKTLNISREGVFLAVNPPKPIGTRVRMNIAIAASNEKFTMEGVVVRSVPDGDEPLKPGEQPGIAVFLTMTSAGFGRFCDDLARGRAEAESGVAGEFADEKTAPTIDGPLVEALRKK